MRPEATYTPKISGKIKNPTIRPIPNDFMFALRFVPEARIASLEVLASCPAR
jgi:hypothetical protein